MTLYPWIKLSPESLYNLIKKQEQLKHDEHIAFITGAYRSGLKRHTDTIMKLNKLIFDFQIKSNED